MLGLNIARLASYALVLTFTVSFILVLVALCDTHYVTAGVAVLQFNASALDLRLAPRRLPLPPPRLITELVPVPTNVPTPALATSAAGVASHAASEIRSMARSATSAAAAAATSVAGAASSALRSTLPANCSIGARQFCVGTRSGNVTCHSLPANLTSILGLTSGGGQATLLQDTGLLSAADATIDPVLQRLTRPYVAGCFITGLLVMAALVVAVALVVHPVHWVASQSQRRVMGIYIGTVVLALLLLVPLIVARAVSHVLETHLQTLPAWIHVELGGLSGLSTGYLICGAVAACATFVAAYVQGRVLGGKGGP